MDIQLPGFVVAELYKDSLVVIPETKNTGKSAENRSEDTEINRTKTGVTLSEKKFWLGDNKRQTAIIVEDPANVFLDDNTLQFLTNILTACKLNLSDVAIVNIAHTPAPFAQLISILNSKFVLLFGIDESKISLQQNAGLFINTTINNIRLVAAPPLAGMMLQTPEAKTLKGKLWNSLKIMFEI